MERLVRSKDAPDDFSGLKQPVQLLAYWEWHDVLPDQCARAVGEKSVCEVLGHHDPYGPVAQVLFALKKGGVLQKCLKEGKSEGECGEELYASLQSRVLDDEQVTTKLRAHNLQASEPDILSCVQANQSFRQKWLPLLAAASGPREAQAMVAWARERAGCEKQCGTGTQDCVDQLTRLEAIVALHKEERSKLCDQ